MSYETPGELYTAIADAIRGVEHSSSPIPFRDFPDRIIAYNHKIPLLGYTGSTWECAVAPYARAGTKTNLSNMFYNLPINTGTIDLTKLEPTYVTSMSGMFYQARIDTVNLSNLGTSSLINMSSMFRSSNIRVLNVEGMDTSNVTTMSRLCDAAVIDDVDFTSWDTSSVTNLEMAFRGHFNTLNLSGWDTSSVTNMKSTFQDCLLQKLDLSGWDTSSVTNMNNMFLRFIGIAWLPSTFVATGVSHYADKPFYDTSPASWFPYNADIYTDATSAQAQGWGSIPERFIMHYNSTYQDFINA